MTSPRSVNCTAFPARFTNTWRNRLIGDYGKRAAEQRIMGPQLLPNISGAAGGVPIRSGNTVIGAVGISGTPGAAGGGEHDAKCAEAGIQKVKF